MPTVITRHNGGWFVNETYVDETNYKEEIIDVDDLRNFEHFLQMQQRRGGKRVYRSIYPDRRLKEMQIN